MRSRAHRSGRSGGIRHPRAGRGAGPTRLVGLHRLVGLAAIAAVTILAGCGSPVSPPVAPSSAASASVAPTPSSQPGGSGEPSSPQGSASTAAADPDLFEVLPATDDILTLTYDPVTTAGIAADPALDPAVDAIATGLYLLKGAAEGAPDFAIVNVVHLRDPSLGDNWYQSWRETYDEGACGQAGGVIRRAETTIGDVTVHVGSCAGGVFTYHVRLNEGNVILSMTSVGPARIGQTVTERMGR